VCPERDFRLFKRTNGPGCGGQDHSVHSLNGEAVGSKIEI
jgi:hypothetical protein